MGIFWEKNRKEAIYAGICIALFLALKYLLGFVLPFVLALLLTLGIGPVVTSLHKKTRICKGLLAIILLLLLAVLLISALGFFCYGFAGKLLLLWENQDSYLNLICEKMTDCCFYIEEGLHLQRNCLVDGLNSGIEDFQTGLSKTVQTRLVPKLFSGSMGCIRAIGRVAGFLLITVFATVLMVKDFDKLQKRIRTSRLFPLLGGMGSFLRVYVLAQLKILSAIAALCLLGFLLTGTKGAMGLALLTACLDVLPFIGTGIILVPMALWKLAMADYTRALLLGVTYIGCIVLREYLEPKLISREIGISPLLTLAGLSIGMKVFGVSGIILGPFYILCTILLYREIFSNS